MANQLEQELQNAISSIPECVAAGYVDLSTGMLLGIKTVDSHPAEVLELLAAATADMFQGTNVVTIENMFKKARGVEDGKHYFNEMIVCGCICLPQISQPWHGSDEIASCYTKSGISIVTTMRTGPFV